MSEELRECPFCGTGKSYFDPASGVVICDKCDARGPVSMATAGDVWEEKQFAIAAWNRRSEPPRRKAEQRVLMEAAEMCVKWCSYCAGAYRYGCACGQIRHELQQMARALAAPPSVEVPPAQEPCEKCGGDGQIEYGVGCIACAGSGKAPAAPSAHPAQEYDHEFEYGGAIAAWNRRSEPPRRKAEQRVIEAAKQKYRSIIYTSGVSQEFADKELVEAVAALLGDSKPLSECNRAVDPGNHEDCTACLAAPPSVEVPPAQEPCAIGGNNCPGYTEMGTHTCPWPAAPSDAKAQERL